MNKSRVESLSDGVIAIQAGRHPVISRVQAGQFMNGSDGIQNDSYIPNDCFLGPLENMHIITGANGAG